MNYFLNNFLQNTLTSYLDSLDCPIDEFYREVRKVQKETDDQYLLTFIDCLLASCDYDSFYKVMVREGKKLKTLEKAESKSESKAESKKELKSEGKASERFAAKGEGKSSYK